MLHDLFALVYISIALEDFDKAKLNILADRANEKNKRLDISGYLCYKQSMFFQYLEGSKVQVIALMDEIELDSRHQVVNLLHIGNIKTRKFLGWSMRYLDDEELRDIKLEDMLNWIITSMKTENMEYETLKESVKKMIQQIKILRNQNMIT